MKNVILTLITILLQTNPVNANGNEGGGGSIQLPQAFHLPFEYQCQLTWIADGVNGTSSTPMSVSKFTLNNNQAAINFPNMKWQHGYAQSLNPVQELTSSNGQGEALKQYVRPSSIAVYFDYAPDAHPPLTEQSYMTTLELDYSVTKSERSHTNISAGTRASMTASSLEVQGTAYSNGAGENQFPRFVFHLSCSKK